MALLIDGYNVLHVAGILGQGVGPGSLQRSRLALLNFLAESLPAEELPRTTVVFDSHDTPPGLPRVIDHRGITVQFAAQYEDADTLIVLGCRLSVNTCGYANEYVSGKRVIVVDIDPSEHDGREIIQQDVRKWLRTHTPS